jgi:protein-S-isoprenylcysteine O-methyltransferase Ste14
MPDAHATPPRETLLGPAIGTLVFVLIVPGSVIGLVPFFLSRWRLQPALLGLAPLRWLGVLLFCAGLPVFVDFLIRFVRDGRGTPAPVAPPRHLVVTGAFRFVRNPGYIGVLAMIFGQGLFLGSVPVLLYGAGVALAFHLFVTVYEEPALRRQFGEEYVAYCRRVPRWIPRRGAPFDRRF